MHFYLLSALIFLPLGFALLVLFLPDKAKNGLKWLNLLVTSLLLLISGKLAYDFQHLPVPARPTFYNQFKINYQIQWIHFEAENFRLHIDYHLGLDGLAMSMVLLSAIVLFIGALSSLTVTQKQKGYFSLYLLLSSSIMGCFLALDFFLFYLFFEFMLLPMYFLIGIWGGERREYASIKFFIYTLLGSLFILIVLIALYLSVQEHSFSIPAMMDPDNYLKNSLLHLENKLLLFGLPIRLVAFLVLMTGFAIKVPVVPFHTWLPDAHVEAPTPISVILAALLLKVGAYGIIRICYSIFPDGAIFFTLPIALAGVISIVYGAMNALAMTDLKKMIAYSSISHMGFVLLGIASLTAAGLNGAIFQMFSHGILSSFLFLIAGVLYDRTKDREIGHYRGLMQPMPNFGAFVSLAFFASLGLPGFSGFIGELFTLMGAFQTKLFAKWIALLGASGILIGAAYFLWALQRLFFGKFWVWEKEKNLPKLKDLTPREWLMFLILSVLTLVTGIFPNLIFQFSDPFVHTFLHLFYRNI